MVNMIAADCQSSVADPLDNSRFVIQDGSSCVKVSGWYISNRIHAGRYQSLLLEKGSDRATRFTCAVGW